MYQPVKPDAVCTVDERCAPFAAGEIVICEQVYSAAGGFRATWCRSVFRPRAVGPIPISTLTVAAYR